MAGWSCCLSAVLIDHFLDDLAELPEAAQPLPGFLGAHPHLVNHRQHRRARHAALGAGTPVTDRRERRLDHIGGARMRPVPGWKVVKREQRITVPAQAVGRLRVFVPIHGQPAVESPLRRIRVSAIQI